MVNIKNNQTALKILMLPIISVLLIFSSCTNQEKTMDSKIFWEIMESSRKKSNGDIDLQTDIIQEQLSAYNPEQLIKFDSLQKQFFTNAWSKKTNIAYFAITAKPLISKKLYAGDNGYNGFLLWLIGQGENTYHQTLENPDFLSNIVNKETDTNMELAAVVAQDVYFEKTGKEMPLTITNNPKALQLHPEMIDMGDYYNEIAKTCPNLWKKFQIINEN